MSMQWWHWLVVGFFLCLCELLVPAFVLVWFGLAALLLGVLMLILPLSLTWQLFAWVVLSTALVVLWLRVFRKQAQTTRSGTSDSAVGEIGILVSPVEPFQRGEVLFQGPLLGSDRWVCSADQKLAANTRVRVLAVEGHTLKVEACSS